MGSFGVREHLLPYPGKCYCGASGSPLLCSLYWTVLLMQARFFPSSAQLHHPHALPTPQKPLLLNGAAEALAGHPLCPEMQCHLMLVQHWHSPDAINKVYDTFKTPRAGSIRMPPAVESLEWGCKRLCSRTFRLGTYQEEVTLDPM